MKNPATFNAERDKAGDLAAGPPDAEPARGRDHRAERDTLAALVGDVDRAITSLPAGSPWRPWLARFSRSLREGADLATVLPKEVG